MTLDLTSLTGGSGSTALEDDIVVVFCNYATTGTADQNIEPTTTGYTELADLYSNDTVESQLYVGYKIMGSTPDTSVVFPNLSLGRPIVASCQVWRGVDTTTPIDVTTTTATGINGGIPTPPAITPTTSGAEIIIVGANGTNADSLITAISSGYSNQVISNNTSSIWGSIASGSKSWTSGTETPGAYTGGGTLFSSAWTAATVVLRPFVPVNEVKSINGVSNV